MVMYHGGQEDNPCWSVQYQMNHTSVYDIKPCAQECTEPRKNRGEELQAEKGAGREGSVKLH